MLRALAAVISFKNLSGIDIENINKNIFFALGTAN